MSEEIETAQDIKNDMKVWHNEFKGKELKVGWGGLGLLIILVRIGIATLKHLEDMH